MRPRAPAAVAALAIVAAPTAAQTALQLVDCTAPADTLAPAEHRISIDTVYGQLNADQSQLTLVALARTPSPFSGYSNATTRLATLFTTASILTFDIHSNPSCFCATIRPPLPLPAPSHDTPCLNTEETFCPLPAGPFAFAVPIPLKHDYDLMPIQTRLRILDVSVPAQQLACVDVSATPLSPNAQSPYGLASIVLWFTVGLFVAYFIAIACARISSAWSRGTVRSGTSFWSRIQRTGFICVSALSGERFTVAPALLRFCTPAARDILFHTQWCASLAMVAIQWPDFAYPILSNTAWSMLLFNVTLTHGATHWNPLDTTDFVPPSGFADQIADPSSPLYLDPAIPNTLLGFPADKTDGISSLASAVGLRPADAFGTSVGLFLCVLGATLVASILVWMLDALGSALFNRGEPAKYPSTHVHYSTPLALGHKDNFSYDAPDAQDGDAMRAVNGSAIRSTPRNRFALSRLWRKTRFGSQSSFHGAVLHGNLTRILMLFHLPVTIFSSYQFSSSASSRTTVILAAVAFAFVSVIWPVILLYRVATTSTSKLYEETRTLMAVGPAYSLYRQDSQLFACVLFASNLALGITIGCGQRSGTAQSIIILVIEVATALTTSLWLPWGSGAHMGITSFLCCAARIISAVLLVILAPIVSVGSAAGGWVAYAILVIQGSVYAVFTLMLLMKVIEGLVRLLTGVPFEHTGGSRHRARSGLFGALAAGCAASRASSRTPKNDRGTKRPKHPRTVSGTSGSSYGELHDPSLAEQAALRPKGASPIQSTLFRNADHADSLSKTSYSRRYDDTADDDDGSIMGAWKHFPQFADPGAADYDAQPPVPAPAPAPAPPAPKTGFARVGGGRAHFDSPYAVVGANKTPPSAFPMRATAAPASATPAAAPIAAATAPIAAATALTKSTSRPSTSGSGNTVRAPAGGAAPLPSGAMPPPTHVRTRSQTAVIEDASTFFARRSQEQQPQADDQAVPLTNVPAIRIIEDHTTTDSDAATPPRRKWFGARSGNSSHAATGSSSAPGASTAPQASSALDPSGGDVPDEMGVAPAAPEESKSKWTFRRSRKSDGDLPSMASPDPPATEGRSFVVVRQAKATPPVTPQEHSFKVVRPSRTPQDASSADTAAAERP
ncbi:hypothetical protein AURDEDRAFT_148582 [Auricularia subglabra TFB-10046 SS5]|nr:hypothetical protein AURDEDRAFT_148582 [Auricularia subglabra TFB-10046 SS5]